MIHKSIFDIELAQQKAVPWPYQKTLDLLVTSGFAEINVGSTYSWWDKTSTNRIVYSFTPEGKEACFRNRYATPMSWAEDIQKGARHCVVCGRDLYRKKVWAQIQDKPRCVCMSCGGKGHGLQDLKDIFLYQVLEEIDGFDGVLLPDEFHKQIVRLHGSCPYSLEELESWLNEK